MYIFFLIFQIWEALENNSSREAIQLVSEGIAVAWRPDGQSLSVSTLAGQILTFDPRTAAQTGAIAGKKDLRAGKGESDKITAKKKSESSHFTSLCYAADGTSLLAGGNSKYICIYHVAEQLLLKKFEVTQNRSFDAMDETLNRRKMTDFGNLALIEDRSDGTALKLPGAKAVDMSSRAFKLEIRVAALRFSPTGRSFSAVTTEGLLVYSLDRHLVFDPYLLEMKITPRSIRQAVKAGAYSRALVTAFKLNEPKIIREVFEHIPSQDIVLLAQEVSLLFLPKMLNFLGEEMEQTRHFEYYLKWVLALLSQHGRYIKDNSTEFMPVLNLLVKNVSRKSEDLGKVCDFNKFSLRYLLQVAKRKAEVGGAGGDRDMETEDSHSEEEDNDEVGDQNDDVDMEELQAKWSDND
jgi:periodic tryptophan protein 2